MAPQKQGMTEYERRRLENIKRNQEMMAAFQIHSKANNLSATTNRKRSETKSYKISPQKKPKIQAPLVIRRSLRARGMPPEIFEGLKDDLEDSNSRNVNPKSAEEWKSSPSHMGPLSTRDVYTGTGSSDRALMETILQYSKKNEVGASVEDEKLSDLAVDVPLDLDSLTLHPENIARVVPGRIVHLMFLPSKDMRMAMVGNKFGDVAFWNMDSDKEEGHGIFIYHPHSAPISGISTHESSMSKIYTSCYDGFLRLMDVEKEVFDLAYSSDDSIYSISRRPDDVKCLYVGEGRGGLSIWDERMGKPSSQWELHEYRINTIDFNSEDTHIMATSSTDGTVCIWDLRVIDAQKPKTLKTYEHERAVHSAYFSPSGSCLATTSMDNTIGILSGANFEDVSRVSHNNQTGRWISSFRAIWGWDDSSIFIGNMSRAVDIISTVQKNRISTLNSPLMSAIPCRFAKHPYKLGTLAGATSGGQVYTWTSC